MTPRSLAVVAAFMAAGPMPALAEACLDEFRAFYAQNMDRFAHPPHRMTLTAYDAEGAELRVFENLIESPVETLSSVRGSGMATLVRDRDVWSGPGLEGPWTSTGTQMPEGRAEDIARIHSEHTQNLTDVACLGQVQREGTAYLAYRWTTVTNPDANGVYFGATNTGYFDLETGRPQVIEQVDMVSSWAPDPSPERHVSVFTYDPALSLPRP